MYSALQTEPDQDGTGNSPSPEITTNDNSVPLTDNTLNNMLDEIDNEIGDQYNSDSKIPVRCSLNPLSLHNTVYLLHSMYRMKTPARSKMSLLLIC